MKTYILGVAVEKGGVGKTTTVVNLAIVFASEGYKVLVVDMDPQANATLTITNCETKNEWDEKDIYSFISTIEKKNDDGVEYIAKTSRENLDIIPSSSLTIAIPELLRSYETKYNIPEYKFLKECLRGIQDNYDIILIDSPPSQGSLAVSAIYASTHLLIPTTADKYAIQGLLNTDALLRDMEKEEEESPEILGIFFSRAKPRTVSHAVFNDYLLESDFYDKLLRSSINEAQVVSDALTMGNSVVESSSKSLSGKQYISLYREIKNRLGMKKRGK